MNKNIFAEYTHQYSLSKTLRFELIPQGKTQEFINKGEIIAEDERRANSYKRVKHIMDKFHNRFISDALMDLKLTTINEYYDLYMIKDKTDSQKKEFLKVESILRKEVIKCLKNDELFAKLFKKEIITEELGKIAEAQEDIDAINDFRSFTTYFQGFFENRKNMYSEEEKSTSVAYRIINQNLPKYIDNIRVFNDLMNTELIDIINEMQENYKELICDKRIEEFFMLENYVDVVTNENINLYNAIIGGFTRDNNEKIKGINEYVNLYNQKNKHVKKLPKLKTLYKQILAEKTSLSFIDEQYSNDTDVLTSISEVISDIKRKVLDENAENSIVGLLTNIDKYDLSKIYVLNGETITKVANALFNDWSVIKKCLENEYDEVNLKKGKRADEKYCEKRNNALNKIDSYSIADLNAVVEKHTGNYPCIQKYFSSFDSKDNINLIDKFNSAYANVEELLSSDYYSKKGLAKDKKNVHLIKELLDAVKNLEIFIKPLLGKGTESDKDHNFYGELESIYKCISAVTPLYNKVRNYVTKKPYSTEKIKLNFHNPTLLKGWDLNKERDNLAVIFKKDDLYYLGIMNKSYNTSFLGDLPADENDYYEKMEYKLLPGPNKMLPKVVFADSNAELFAPTSEIVTNYENGTHKKNEPTFDLKKCHNLIDYFKKCIYMHEDWKNFGFTFTETSEYSDISQFYHEVEKQGYMINFRKVAAQYIDELVESGKLYLFQIYNKDFSKYSKGKPNLHTIYWKLLFDENNMKDVVYKLNGEAEVFYRRASISEEDKIIHPKNEEIAKKHYLSKERGETSIFSYDLIKDKRYTVDKYQFHVPITINFCAEGKNRINEDVLSTIRRNEDMYAIGIDRGERNLLYISVVNSQGKIVHQESLNYIENDRGYAQDYHKLLDTKEKELDKARKNWDEIETIKELKEGYLSQAIHKITTLMIKYNAIVVLEDLNFGFMNGRKKVGKQIYQKFEKMLIDKLNFLVDKNKEPLELGGALNGYQLTNRFESFSKLGKQSGFLFYIPAWNTSKIDPTTGFVNLLYPKYVNIEETREFINKFDDIKYNKDAGYFEFQFDYNNFTDKAYGTKTKWTICSYGTRIVTFRDSSKNSEWSSMEIDITQKIRDLLELYEIDIYSKKLSEDICNIDNAEFYRKFIECIKNVLQIRNSITGTDIDYMLSPVMNEKGEFFDSRKGIAYLPLDADANGAYNIARKGLWVMEQIRQTEDSNVKLAISNKQWLDYAQNNIVI